MAKSSKNKTKSSATRMIWNIAKCMTKCSLQIIFGMLFAILNPLTNICQRILKGLK